VNIPYLASVDHLRCAAALLIVYYHAVQLFSSQTRSGRLFSPANWISAPDPFSALIVEGHTAVALFMVLSGFIFAFGATGQQVSYRGFLWNRFIRTYPLFMLVLLVGTAVHRSSVSLLPLLQTIFGGANLAGAQLLGNFSPVLWSVAVEWQFYLLFPALMAILNRAGPRQLALLGVLVIAVRTIGFFQGLNSVHGVYSQLIGRLDQFILGMIAGFAYSKYRSSPLWHYVFPPTAALILAGAWAFNRMGGWPYQHWFKLISPTLEGGLWALLIAGYVALVDASTARQGVLSRCAAAVGATSYSIYLWHFPFIEIQRTHGWVPRWLAHHELNAALVTTLTTLPVLLGFSFFSYHTVEKPFLALRKRYLADGARPLPAERVVVETPARSPEVGRRLGLATGLTLAACVPLVLLMRPEPVSEAVFALGGADKFEEDLALGAKLVGAGNAKESLALLDRALKANPNSFAVHNNLCVAYGLLQRRDEAVQACERALGIDPTAELGRNNLAWVRTISQQSNPGKK
jgi:peptidoglycan/LPS O-acetylase OafA/YrhL